MGRPTEAEVIALPILYRHKREIISAMLWKITEARGKFATRYQSAEAAALYRLALTFSVSTGSSSIRSATTPTLAA
jgi:hypothetical protein